MLRKYKNELPELFAERGFMPNDFTFEERGVNFIITYRDSPMKFHIHQHAKDFNAFRISYTHFTPDFKLATPTLSYVKFEHVKTHLSSWCNGRLQEYIFEEFGPDELNAWNNKNAEFVNVEDIDFDSDEPFSPSEIESVKEGIEEVRTLLLDQLSLSEESTKELNSRIDYLIEATERASSKTDWKNILIATVINLAITLALDPEKTKLIWLMFGKVLSKIQSLGEVIGIN